MAGELSHDCDRLLRALHGVQVMQTGSGLLRLEWLALVIVR